LVTEGQLRFSAAHLIVQPSVDVPFDFPF